MIKPEKKLISLKKVEKFFLSKPRLSRLTYHPRYEIGINSYKKASETNNKVQGLIIKCRMMKLKK